MLFLPFSPKIEGMDEQLIGKIIKENYEITGRLAQGGMATVFRAHQLSMQRDVAIKMLPPEFLHDPTFRERFRQEAAIAAKLEHRAIVPVYDYGEWEGAPYIVMRLLEGGSVDNLLLVGAMSLERTQQIIRQIASALDYAHEQGVLHRDLKPSNILLDRNGDAYITDFGIARLLTANQQLTATGVVGTPAYMSPEQAQGFDLDNRSDIYALGVVIYEMVVGRRPFEAETPYSIAVMHVTQAPPPPRFYKPDLPLGVEHVILKALSKDREKRYRSAVELAGALDDADLLPALQTQPHATPQTMTMPLSITPASVSPPLRSGMPTNPQNQPRRRRRPSAVMYLAVATLIALLLGGLLLVGYLLVSGEETATYTEPDFAATGVFRLTATAEFASD